RLQNLVKRGHAGNPSTPVYGPATDKYCDRDHMFAADPDAGLSKPVRVRCLRTSLYSSLWTVFFCHPDNCNSERMAKAVSASIAADPDVVALASGNSAIGPPKGPYLITIETTGK